MVAISKYAFSKCSNFKYVSIGENIKVIGKRAFYKCKNLKRIVIKSTKLTSTAIGSKAFYGISKKAKIKVPKNKIKAYKKLLRLKGISRKAKLTH